MSPIGHANMGALCIRYQVASGGDPRESRMAGPPLIELIEPRPVAIGFDVADAAVRSSRWVTRSSASVVQVTAARPSRTLHTSVPVMCCGVALRRQGPGDWMLPGHVTTVESCRISSKTRRSEAFSATRM
jgi:hypothetical protein